MSVTSWVAESAAARLRRQALGEFLADWQAEHGEISADEVAHARAELGQPDSDGHAA